MKVLVLGGTGAMGVYLVRLLEGKGIDTVVTTRSKRQSSEKIQYIQGNAHDWNFLHNILSKHWDVIVDFMIYDTKSFSKRVNILLAATNQYIFISSSRVYANSYRPINETSCRLLDVSVDKEYLQTDEYALTKARQENILFKSKSKNWTVIRPYITYNPHRLQLGELEKEDWLYRAIHGRAIVFSNDVLKSITTLTYGLDVSNGISSIIGNPKALGEIFHITTEESMTWKEVLSLYLKVLEINLGYMPKIVLYDLGKNIKSNPKKYQIQYDRLYDRVFDNSKISQFIDVNRFIGIETGLKLCLEKFLEDPKFKSINWRQEALKDRISKEYTPFDEIVGIKQKIKYLLYRYCFSIINV